MRVLADLAVDRLRALWRGAPAIALVTPRGATELLGDGAPAATVRVRDGRALRRVLFGGERGAGEGYVAGEWDTDDLVALVRAFLRASEARGVESTATRIARLPARLARLLPRGRRGARRDVHAHYDLGNELYRAFLDEQLVYSCAIWAPGDDLAGAQRRKLDRICDLADLQPGDEVLELGCGWGALAIHAARSRGCRVTAVTISDAQAAWAEAAARAAGVADRVRVVRRDWRDVRGRWDRVVSVEMIEAIGAAQLAPFFARIGRDLRRGGRAVIQSITMPEARWDAYRRDVDWMQTYVFPGTTIPSRAALTGAARRGGLAVASIDEIGPDYAPTLAAWRARFRAAEPAVRALGFDDRFLRTWDLYLAFSEAAFAERTLGDVQMALSSAPG